MVQLHCVSAYPDTQSISFWCGVFCSYSKVGLCAPGKTSQHLAGKMLASAMLPPQCILVLPGPNATNSRKLSVDYRYISKQFEPVKLTTLDQSLSGCTTVERREPEIKFQVLRQRDLTYKVPAKRGHIVAATLCPTTLPVRGKTWLHCCTPRGHELFPKIFRNIFCVQDTKIVSATRGKTGQLLRNMIMSVMLPPQCVLVLPAPNLSDWK